MKNIEIEKIKEKIRIENLVSEYVNLTQKGKNLWGVCPFHTDTNPSMSVSIDKQIFKCFVCQIGGDIFKFIVEFKKISFQEAVRFLAEKIGIKVESKIEKRYSKEEQKTLEVLNEAMNFYSYYLNSNEGKNCLEYAKKRGLDSTIQQEFSIGFAPEKGLIDFLKTKNYPMESILNASLANTNEKDFFKNRLIFGIKDDYGKVVGFSGRSLSEEDNIKYMNSAESSLFKKSNILYNFFNAKKYLDSQKQIYVNEGFMDVIAMYKAGFKNSIAIMGTALTQENAKKLKNLKVALMLDNDQAGIIATFKSILILLQNQIHTSVIVNKKGKDADEVLTNEGKEALVKIVNNKIPAIEFVFDFLSNKTPLTTPENINGFLREFQKYLSLTDAITQGFYVEKLFEITKIDKETIKQRVLKQKKQYQNVYQQANQIPREQTNIQTTKKQQIGKNYSYILINSIMKKMNLIDLIEKENIQINFFESLVLSIFTYYKKIRQGQKMILNQNEADEIAFKLFEIKQSDEYYQNENEFKEIANRTNYEYINFQIEANKVKLDNTIDQKGKIKVLENIKLLEIQKRKLRDKLDENGEE